jgi:hypothetical protein
LFLPLHIIAERFIAKNIQDPLFPNSIRIVFWTFGGLLLSLIFAVPLSFFIPLPMSYPIGFFGLLLSGFVGIKSIFAWRNWKLTKSVHANANTNPQLWNRWLELRAQLRQRIDAIK